MACAALCKQELECVGQKRAEQTGGAEHTPFSGCHVLNSIWSYNHRVESTFTLACLLQQPPRLLFRKQHERVPKRQCRRHCSEMGSIPDLRWKQGGAANCHQNQHVMITAAEETREQVHLVHDSIHARYQGALRVTGQAVHQCLNAHKMHLDRHDVKGVAAAKQRIQASSPLCLDCSLGLRRPEPGGRLSADSFSAPPGSAPRCEISRAAALASKTDKANGAMSFAQCWDHCSVFGKSMTAVSQ